MENKYTLQNSEKRHPSADAGARTRIRLRNARRVHLGLGNFGPVTRVRGEADFAEAFALRHHKHAGRGTRLNYLVLCRCININE